MEPFTPSVLTPEQLQQINAEALAQSELSLLNAERAYLRQRAAHEALVAALKPPQNSDAPASTSTE